MVFERDASYQRPRLPVDEDHVKSLSDNRSFLENLDEELRYQNYLVFFQREIEAKGPKAVIHETLFANDAKTNAMLCRAFSGECALLFRRVISLTTAIGIMHPIIHIGYALEFNQPAILAEGLAMAAVQERNSFALNRWLLAVERAALGTADRSKGKTLRAIFNDAEESPNLRGACYKGSELEKLKNLLNQPDMFDELVDIASQYTLTEEQAEARLLEMLDVMSKQPPPLAKFSDQSEIACTMAVVPGDVETHKVNFFLLHSVNSLVLWPSLLAHPWMSEEDAIRLLEWQGRYNLLLWVGENLPNIKVGDLQKFNNTAKSWDEIFHRAINHKTDDGHLCKFIRTCAYGDRASKKAEAKNCMMLREDAWRQIAGLGKPTLIQTRIGGEQNVW